MVTHSKEKRLDDYEFQHYLRGCHRIEKQYQYLEALFIAYVAGRLGLRLGEITHFKSDWVNWRDRRIEIPRQQDCHKGRDREICGLCKQQSDQRAEYSQISLAEARLKAVQEQLTELPPLPGDIRSQLTTVHMIHINSDLSDDSLERQVDELLSNAEAVDDADEFREALDQVARDYKADNEISPEEAADMMWMAKTDNAAREVPFGWCPGAEITLEQFCEAYDGWMHSHTAVRRRMKKTLRYADGLDEDTTTCHGLRATAASHLASKGLPATSLKSMMGWSQLSTAKAYIEESTEQTQRQLHSIGSI